MKKLELFIILFLVYYLEEMIFPETNKILKYPIYPGEYIWGIGCWLCMG